MWEIDWDHFVFENLWFMNVIPGIAGIELWFFKNLTLYVQGNKYGRR
jgi:hypothetical protein